jgi:MSHA biogenesis protein MshQ
MTRVLHCLVAWALVLGAQSVEAVIAFRAAASAGVRSATISLRGTGSAVSAASGNITPTLSSSERNGLLVCVVEQHDNVAIAFPAGWVPLYSITTTTTHRASVFYKVAGNTETNPAISHSGGNAIIAQCSTFRGTDAANPWDVAYAAQYAASSTSVASTSLTTVTANDWMLYAMHVANNPTVTVAPSGTGGVAWTNRFYNSTASALRAAVGLYTGTKTTAGAVGPISATVSLASENSGVLMALRNGSRLSIPVPVGTVVGDVMVAAVTVTASSVPITAPAGWIAIVSTTQSGATTSKLATFFRVATASEPASYAWTLSTTHTGAAGGITSFSGVDTTNPVHLSAAQNSGTASVSQVAPGVTTTVANGMLVTAHELASSPYSTSASYLGAWLPPSGMTEAVDERSRAGSSTSGIALEMNYLLLGAAGGTGTRSATAFSGSDNGASVTIVLKPTSGLDHLQIDFPQATLSSCTPTPVTVTACASSGTTCTSLYTGGVSGIALTPGGGTISIPAGSGCLTRRGDLQKPHHRRIWLWRDLLRHRTVHQPSQSRGGHNRHHQRDRLYGAQRREHGELLYGLHRSVLGYQAGANSAIKRGRLRSLHQYFHQLRVTDAHEFDL